MIKPQIEFRQYQDNVQEDQQKPQAKTSTSRLALTFDYSVLPSLTLAYETGKIQRTSRAGEDFDQRADATSYSANLWYGGNGWEIYGTTSQYLETDQTNDNYQTNYFDHILGGSFTFFDSLTIDPSLQFTQAENPSDQYSSRQLYGNLGIYYFPPVTGLSFSLYGYFGMDRDSSGWVDNRNMDMFFSVEQDLKTWLDLPHQNTKLILRLDHSEYTDQISAEANTFEDSALLLLSISP